jgi:Ca2+-binding RTX toxin-like protein
VSIRGDASANASAFTTVANNVSSRAQTSASVGWTIASWSTVGAAGVDQRTPDLTSIVQQIVGTSGWSALNSMAFIVSGSGTRTAWAYDGNAAAAPLLHIEYTLAPLSVGDISIGDVSIAEGDSGTKTATFTVSRTGTAAFSVGYATADGTASAGSDYVASTGVLNFSYGQTTQTVSVTINGDTVVEPNETFFVNLSNASNGGAIVDGQGLGTITNEDGPGFNHAPTAIALNAPQPVKENVAGIVVGTLSTTDDAGDTHSYSVSDSRFEVVGNQLKLKAGQRLDFERAATIGLNITATDQGGLSVTKGVIVSVGDVAEVRFAAFGDYGGGSGEQAVANLIAGMNVDFIVTTGDNLYISVPIDEQIGRYYSNYIGNYVGAYGAGSAINRFFPTVGNHEYEDPSGGANAINYYNYFILPDNERYYDYQMGSIHFFSLNSAYEPDGYKNPSVQASWLQSGLAASDSPFDLVLVHYPPYSSGVEHGSTTNMQWPFESWGATAVLNGHDHDYERILRDDNGDGATMPYFVTGLGGFGKYGLGTTVSGSQVFYSADYGAMLIQASDATITFEFWSVANGGTLIDSYTIDREGADPLLADGDDIMNGSASSDYMDGLSGADRLEGKGGNDMLIGGVGSDTFVFRPGFGRDTIADFVVEGTSHDVIEFSTAVFADWNALRAAITDSVQGAVITLDANNTITLANVTGTQLIANNGNDFLFLE